MSYKIAAITHPGISDSNQDNFFCNGIFKKSIAEKEFEMKLQTSSNRHNVFAVFDGVGGLSEGSVAALVSCEALYDICWAKKADVGAAILEADSSIMKTSRQSGLKMGSTCVIVEEEAGRFRSWNVGDSRAYYYHEEKLHQLSKDHTEAENARTIQNITGESFQIPEKYEHTLTQYLGADKSIYVAEPFVSEWVTSKEGDKFLLCSDGLYNFIDIKTITEILKKNATTSDKCRDLIEKAVKNRGKDNITVVLIEDENE